ncbi:MAG: SEC-C metal-binding domain-containing protein, partial [Dehalococcoidia bacterium]
HLYDLDHLKASIGFRGWGQKDPLVEYKKEAYEMFVDLMTDLRKTVASYFFRAQFGQQSQQRRPQQQRLAYSGPSDTPEDSVAARAAQAGRQAGQQGGQPAASRVDEFGVAASAAAGAAGASGPDPRQLSTNRGEQEQQKQEPVTVEDEPGRNDPCPCGSGKKYKKCHGRV